MWKVVPLFGRGENTFEGDCEVELRDWVRYLLKQREKQRVGFIFHF